MEQFPTCQNDNSLNCWEFTQCGREPGGRRADDLGVCPAAADGRFDGLNGGINAGRVCWAVAGTCNHERPQGIYAGRARPCATCAFFKLVHSTADIVSDDELAMCHLSPLCRDDYHLTAC